MSDQDDMKCRDVTAGKGGPTDGRLKDTSAETEHFHQVTENFLFKLGSLHGPYHC